MANLGELRSRAAILEFDIQCKPTDALEKILANDPRIIGVGVYIWNVRPATELVAQLKRLRPQITVIVGGPEVSHEIDQQEICQIADYVISGEADLALAQLCGALLAGERPAQKIVAAPLPSFEGPSAIVLPYDLYTDEDVRHRVVYVEASRGCPFKCEFCLSSLDVPVRNVRLDDFLSHLDGLLERGVRQFKFVDRTFNLNLKISTAILDFFLKRMRPELFLHFEMIPDRLPDALRQIMAQFPPGALQFEVGIQTFNPAVAALISRRQDNQKLAENLMFLRQQTGVHVHADLIVGLPGEDVESFAAGFDRLVALRPQEIQVGLLKRLRGTPIVRHDGQWGMIYNPNPPYEIMQTCLIDFSTMQRLKRFARFWDLVANSGNFISSAPMLWLDACPFDRFLKFSDWLFTRHGKTHCIALIDLAGSVFEFLTKCGGVAPPSAAAAIWEDYQRGRNVDPPAFLSRWLPPLAARRSHGAGKRLPDRQRRHLSASSQ